MWNHHPWFGPIGNNWYINCFIHSCHYFHWHPFASPYSPQRLSYPLSFPSSWLFSTFTVPVPYTVHSFYTLHVVIENSQLVPVSLLSRPYLCHTRHSCRLLLIYFWIHSLLISSSCILLSGNINHFCNLSSKSAVRTASSHHPHTTNYSYPILDHYARYPYIYFSHYLIYV